MTRPSPRSGKNRHLMLWLILLLALIYMGGFVYFVRSLPPAASSVSHADGIVALTGGDERVSVAVQLLENRDAERLLITGVHPATTKDEIRLLAHGGPRFDCCADLGFAAANTRGNAHEAATWARQHNYHSLIVVTARYHMPRSLAEFSAAMPHVRLEPYSVQPEDIDLDNWWRDLRALRVLQSEYLKFLATVGINDLRHWYMGRS